MLTRVVANDLGAKTETAAMAQWMIGETFFHQKKMTDAIRAYHRVEALYEYPVWQALSLLQAGKCHERLQQPVEARRLYAQVLREFADTPAARDAAKRLRVEPRDTVRAAGNRAGNSRHPASKRAPVRDPQGKTAGRMRNPFGVLQEMVSRGAAEVKSDNMKQR